LVKDIMAGAVLLTAFCAVILGLFIFFPYLVRLVK
jgi:diacylglycerol kinase